MRTRVPHARWGGRYLKNLQKAVAEDVVTEDEWTDVGEYARTAGYQVARMLNLNAILPQVGPGYRLEFGSRESARGCTLVVRLAPIDGD
jgi:hypothetical protein